MKKLTRVNFNDTGITRTGIKQLKAKRPDLTIGPKSLIDPCTYSLNSIEYAKSRWADQNKIAKGIQPTKKDIECHLISPEGWKAMVCQDDGSISINPIGEPASCSIHGKTKPRKRSPQPEGLSKEDFDIHGATVGRWTMDFNAARTLAAEKQLPILLNFTGSDWCYWCKLMEKNVFQQPKWQAYATNHIVMVLIDFPRNKTAVPEKYKERNNTLKKQYEISGYPTFVLLRPDGNTEIARLKAGRNKTAETFIEEIKAAHRKKEEP
jgi:hypothetical protein